MIDRRQMMVTLQHSLTFNGVTSGSTQKNRFEDENEIFMTDRIE